MVEYALIAGFLAVAVAAAVPYSAVPAVSHIFSKLNDVCIRFIPAG
jgi:Flp pilus assembly pilin Flp